MPLAPGMAVGQNVRLVRLLARGGMGSVWVAEHLGLKTGVAVKFIDETLGEDTTLRARFAREASAAAQIRSPHVVQIFDHGFTEDRVPYIVMELLEGESFGERIRRVGVVPLDEVAVVLSQTCKALSRAHALGIVHRDIKPDNIFLTDSDGDLFVKVLDFGIAKRQGDDSLAATSTGMTVGTPHYMSPEQLLSARNSVPATDLWAIAAATYRAVTGWLPFDAETFAGLCIAINKGVFEPASEHRPGLPPTLDAWFAKALAVDPAARFASGRELSDAFVVAAGLSSHRLTVPSALPKASAAQTVREPSNPSTGPRTSTAAAPDDGDLARLLAGSEGAAKVATPRATPLGHDGGNPSEASIAAASVSSDSFRSRSRAPLVAVVVLGAALIGAGIVVFIRGAPPGSPASGSASTPAAAVPTLAPDPHVDSPVAPSTPVVAPEEARSAEPASTGAPLVPSEHVRLPQPDFGGTVAPSPGPHAHTTGRHTHGAAPSASSRSSAPATSPAKGDNDYGF